jgi:hypothetical protein
MPRLPGVCSWALELYKWRSPSNGFRFSADARSQDCLQKEQQIALGVKRTHRAVNSANMKSPPLLLLPTLFASGCIPAVRMTVETRDPHGSVIERADVTNSDTNGRTFHINSDGSIELTASAQDSSGLQAMRIEGGFSCTKASGATGTIQQGGYLMNDPNLPGQHPTSETFQNSITVLCPGGTYNATIHACATNAKGGSSCTKDAAFQ